MGFLDNVFKGMKRYPGSVKKRVGHSAESLTRIVNESISLASAASDIETKKTRLDYAMKKLVELIKLANEYPFLDFRKISTIYESIREVRNEIKEMEPATGKPPSSEMPDASDTSPAISPAKAGSKEFPVCPYCSYQLVIMPQRKTSCPSCNKTIFVWYSTKENTKKLVTEEEALKIEKEISEHIEQYEFLNKQDVLQKSDDEVKEVRDKLKKDNPEATLDDAYFYLLDKKIHETGNEGEKSRLYYLKALLLDNAGKDFITELTESRRYELLNLKKHEFVNKVQIISSPDCCKVCHNDSDKVLNIEDALRLMPLPHTDCDERLYSPRGFCRCSYLIVNE